ncbi:MAG TPA: TRAP transporter small permease [Kiloniellales bacterium]|jgi:TRAP-type C4-dicarboxylate transport system permease small subunit
MTVFLQSVRRLSRLCGVISAALLLAAVLVVTHLVFVRYILGTSAIWQHEFVTFSLIAATFFGGPYLLLTHGHVNVDLLPMYLGRRGRKILALLAAFLSLGFCLIIAWMGFVWWQEAWINDWHAETVWKPPLWIPYLAMPIGVGLMALQYIADILALVTGRAAPFGMSEDGSREPA